MATNILLDKFVKQLCLIPLALAGLPAAAAPAPGPAPATSRVRTCVRNQAVPRLSLPAELFRLQTVCAGVVGCQGGALRDWQTTGTGVLWNGQLNHVFTEQEQNTIVLQARVKAASQQPPGLALIYIVYATSLNSATTAYMGGTIHYARCGSNESAD